MNENDGSSMFDNYELLNCEVCGKDLLEEGQGIVASVYPYSTPGSESTVVAVYAACKGICDKTMESLYNDMRCTAPWEDLQDLIHPQGFTRWDMALMNRLYVKEYYSPEAFEALKEIKLKISQKVFRQPTTEEREKHLEDQRWRDLGPL